MSDSNPLDGASGPLAVALAIRFLLELALLAGAATVAWHLAAGWWQWVAVILTVAAVVTVWGLFLSPKAAVPLPQFAVLAIETALFVGTGAGLVVIGLGLAAVVGVALWIADRLALGLLRA